MKTVKAQKSWSVFCSDLPTPTNSNRKNIGDGSMETGVNIFNRKIDRYRSRKFLVLVFLAGCVRVNSGSDLKAPPLDPSQRDSIQIEGCTFGRPLPPRVQCQSTGADKNSCTRRFLPDTISEAELGRGPVLEPVSPFLPALKTPAGPLCPRPKTDLTPDLWVETSGRFVGVNNIPIAYKVIRKVQNSGSNPLVFILPGYNENILLYTETITDFLSHGFEVAIMDHRGMGLSGRFPMMQNKGYIDDFTHYVSDAQFFL